MFTNRHGLTRTIPSEVKRLVRQRCGFGCVICGLGFYDYEHVEPLFADARTHDPDAIVLLCPNHHAAVTRGTMSKSKVMEFARNPMAVQQGYAFGVLESTDRPLVVELGGGTITDMPIIMQFGNIPLLGFKRPQFVGDPWLMNAFMADTHGNPIITINDNEWRANTKRWDIATEGQRIKIRSAPKDISLVMKHIPGERIIFERMKIKFAGFHIDCNEEKILISSPSGRYSFSKPELRMGEIAMYFQIDPLLEKAVDAWMRVMGAQLGVAPRVLQNLRL